MTETYENTSFYEALSGTTDNELGIPYITKGTGLDWYATYMKMLYTLRQSFFPAGQLRVYKDGDLTVGVYAGKWINGNTEVSYSGSSSNSITDNATNYVYLTADGTLTINTTGYPAPTATSHIRLGRVVASSGAITNIYDDRAYNIWSFTGSGGSSTLFNLLDWQESVLDEVDFTTAEPSSPSDGDRYLNTVTGTSSGTSQSVTANYIYEWNGTNWTEIAPDEGTVCLVEDRDMLVGFNGSSWVDIGTFALLNEAQTFFNNTDITGSEAETLTDGSNADSLHVHTLDSGVTDVTATASEVNQVCDGVSANVTATNLSTLTGAGNSDSLHTHTLDSGITDVTATASEINQALDGISANVTDTNLNTLTGGGNADSLHTHGADGIDGRYSLSGTTTDATETEIYVNGVSGSRISIASGHCYTFRVQVSALRTETSTECAGYTIEGVIKNASGTTSLVGGTVVTSLGEDDSTWDVQAYADDTNDALIIKVTGAASKTINWKATVDLTDVS